MPPQLTNLTSTSLPSQRSSTNILSANNVHSFLIAPEERSYRHQYANIYYIRLRLLRESVEKRALALWKGLDGNPIAVPRVLEVTKGQLCYIIGTVYMDMPLKPNVLDDIARDHSLPAPLPLPQYYSSDDRIMLEDESGRIQLVGDRLKDARLVTGVVMGALGMETPNGEFEVADFCFADMGFQTNEDIGPDYMDIDNNNSSGEWIAVLSGLNIGSPTVDDAKIQMLLEYLVGEAGGTDDQSSSCQISRLIIVGNSLIPTVEQGDPVFEYRLRHQDHEITPASSHPILCLSAFLHDVCQTMPVHILPGEGDPAGTILPQQPFPRAMFGEVFKLASFHCETNPTYLRLQCAGDTSMARTLLINSGQPLNDMFKYLSSPPNTRLDALEATLRWKHMAPTAPDTLWCHPYFTKDPFLLTVMPDLYIVGCQKCFGTRLVTHGVEVHSVRRSRVVMVPNFSETGVLALVNLRTLDVKTVRFGTDGSEDTTQDSDSSARSVSPTEPPPESVAASSPGQDMDSQQQ